MYYKSKKVSLIILGITSLIFSREMFMFMNDPEGPNLLVVFVMSATVFSFSLSVYYYVIPKKFEGLKRLLTMIFVQLLIVTIFYFCLR